MEASGSCGREPTPALGGSSGGGTGGTGREEQWEGGVTGRSREGGRSDREEPCTARELGGSQGVGGREQKVRIHCTLHFFS